MLWNYDKIAEKEGNSKLIDSPVEMVSLFNIAKTCLKHRKMTKAEYKKFLTDFADCKKVADEYLVNYCKDIIPKIKNEIAKLEKDIAEFEKYKKENPKKSAANNFLNNFEVKSKQAVSIVGSIIAYPFITYNASKNLGKSCTNWVNKSIESGAIENSEYNKLRKNADYEKLNDLKKVLQEIEQLYNEARRDMQVNLNKLG